MDIQDFISSVGGYGKYQRFMLWLVLLPAQLPYLCQVYAHLFLAITPDHWCRVSLLDPFNVTEHFSRHLFVPKKNRILYSLEYEQCFVYNITYKTLLEQTTRVGWVPDQTWPVSKCLEGWVYNRTVLGEDNSIATEWDLVCDRAFHLNIPLMVFFIGAFFGQIIGIILSKIIGKKRTYFLMLCLLCLLGAGTALTNRFSIFCVLRFGVGFTVTNIASIPRILSLELVPHQKRWTVLLLSELFRTLSSLLLVCVSYLVRDFRHLSLAISLPFAVFIFYFCLFPESIEWLIMNEKIESVDRLVTDMALANVTLLSNDMTTSLRRRVRIECALQSERIQSQTRLPFRSFSSCKECPKVSILCLLYITHSVVDIAITYSVLQFADNKANLYFPYALTVASNLIGLAMAGLTLSRFGRKYPSILGDLLSGVFGLMSAMVSAKDTHMCLIYFLSMKVFQSCSHYCLIVLSVELMPFSQCLPMISTFEVLSHLAQTVVPILLHYTLESQISVTNGITLSQCQTLLSTILVISAALGFTLADTKPNDCGNSCTTGGERHTDISHSNNWSQCLNKQKKPKNGILKNRGPQPQSPILSLLRKQELIRQNECDSEYNERITELKDSPKATPIRVTVL